MANPTYLSNLSYVNKDFQSIYVELLDLVKKLTYRWDPSISNESDPGVLLIKLMAICADKNNYTSDKNVLECFPESVTQVANARQLFEQLGYTMHWYRAATTTISMRWIGDESIYAYTVPRFTMVSNDRNSIVYTIVDEREITGDGEIVTANVVQGVAETYTVNGEELITSANLDANNRLYFPDMNVAENGIFICNADSTSAWGRQENYDSWVRKTNLAVEPLGQYCYKFGVSNDGESCYIEFPEDIQSLMGEGLYITYIRTDGESGNISAKMLEKFYNDVTITDPADPESSFVLDSSNVLITNLSSATNGYDPESIDSAYRNYKRTVGTFNTLVTIRDYANAIIESGLVSNGFVCDRTNDLQVSYDVLSTQNDVTHYITCVEEDADHKPIMDAFDLKMFLLRKVDRPSSAEDYNNTFDIIVNDEDDSEPVIDSVLSYINELKSVQHDFQPILPNKIAMFFNKYVVDCKIIPQYRVTTLQEEDIRNRVQRALFTELNSQMIDFGEEVTYSQIYDIIMNADERIKAITLDTLTFTTYAVYYDGSKFVEVPLSDLNIADVGVYDESTDTMTLEHQVAPVTDEVYYATNTHTAYVYNANVTPHYQAKPEVNFAVDIFAKSILHGNTPLTEKVDDFLLAYNQESINSVSNIEKVDTDVKIHFDASAVPTGQSRAEVVLRENEVMQFYAPNLIDKLQYSNYVKYQFKLVNQNNPVHLPANSDYTLQPGDELVLYWKNSDEDVDYVYQKYVSPTIVHTSFPLDGPVNLTNYTGVNLPVGRGTTAGATFPYTKDGVTEDISVTTYVESQMNSSAYVLTSTKTITIRDTNRLELDNRQYKCYWKLNSKTGGMYELFPEGEAGEVQTYLLQNGEYFFYTNLEETMLAYWGEGTRIERDCDAHSSAMVCAVADISSFQSDGLKSFTDYWVMLGSTYRLIGEETQFIALGAGTKVAFQGNSANAFSFTVNGDGISWGTGATPDINQYTISYQTSDSTEATVLPKVLIRGTGWNCRAILNFVPGPSNPQKLLTDQWIKYYSIDGISSEINGDDSNPIYLLADYAYAMDGGKGLDITRMNSSGDTVYADLYWYRSSSSTSGNVDYKANGSAKLTFTQTGQTISFDFKLPYTNSDDLFFVPLHNPYKSTDTTALSVSWSVSGGSGDTVVTDIFGNDDFSANGEYYLVMRGQDFQNKITMKVHLEYTGEGSRVITLRPPYRVAIPEEMSEAEFTAMYDKVIALDIDRAFDYTYQVEEEDLIQNPLDPESFLNTKHIFNKFTICQLDTSKLSVFITNKIK